MTKTIIAALTILLLAGQAEAACPSRPENADSQYVTNGVDKSLCQAYELGTTTRQIDSTTQFDALSTQVNQLEIQRRFDNLPTTSPAFP